MHQTNSVDRKDLKLCLLAALILGLLYCLLQNGQWIPGGSDDAFYLDIARNMVAGKGFTVDDVPVVIIPPGWPMALAGVMRLSSSFALLNLLPMTFLVVAASVWYLILRRFARPWSAFAVVLIVGVLFQWHRLGFHLYSDAIFCLLLSVNILLGLQISEKRPAGWRIPVLLVLCAFMVGVRWAGIIGWLPVAGALLCGQRRVRLNRQWLVALLTGMIIASTFVGLRYGFLRSIRQQHTQAKSPEKRALAKGALDQDARRMRAIFNPEKAKSAVVLLTMGNWLAKLLWPPAELGTLSPTINIATSILGWLLLSLFLLRLWKGTDPSRWLLFGGLLYYMALSFGWSASPCRYIVPVAPLILLGIRQGFDVLRTLISSFALKRLITVTAVGLAGSVVLCNLIIFGANAWLIRSDEFVSRWQAGEYAQLLGVAARLRQGTLADGKLAVNADYTNMNKGFSHRYSARMMRFTTGKKIRIVPRGICQGRFNQVLIDWFKKERIRYYLYRPPVNPWRLWHFRMPRVQEFVTGKPSGSVNPYFELYQLIGDDFVRLELSEIDDGLKKVPSLD